MIYEPDDIDDISITSLDDNDGELLSDFLSELFKDDEEKSDKHSLNELIKNIH